MDSVTLVSAPAAPASGLADAAEGLATLSFAEPLMPMPVTGLGGDSVAIAILWLEALRQDRKAGRQAAAASSRAIETANAREIRALRQQARAERHAATWRALGGLVESGTALVGACHGPLGAGEMDTGDDIAKGGGFFASVTGLPAAAAENQAADAAAAAAAARHRANAAERGHELAKRDLADTGDVLDRVLELLRDMYGAQRASESAAVVRG